MDATFLLIIACLLLLTKISIAFTPRSFSSVKTKTSLNMGIKVICNDDQEPVENILKRFKRACNQSGHLMDLRFKEQWETAAERKKRKATKARLLNRIERTNDKYEKRAYGASEYNS